MITILLDRKMILLLYLWQNGLTHRKNGVNAIHDLMDLLDSYNLPEGFRGLQKQLVNTLKFIESQKIDPEDEFYFVPSGYRPTDETKTTDTPVPAKSTKSKSSRENLQRYVHVYHTPDGYVQIPPKVKVKVKNRPRRSDYDLVVTSKPEELAIKHSKHLLKSLSITY